MEVDTKFWADNQEIMTKKTEEVEVHISIQDPVSLIHTNKINNKIVNLYYQGLMVSSKAHFLDKVHESVEIEYEQ
jgi:hypothetical protein